MNKKAFAIGLLLVVAAFFVATQPITPQMAVVSSLSVIGFALPSYLAVVKLLGQKRGELLLVILGIYALLIESSAIHTGFPYGKFVYTNVLGGKVFGLTPWTVAFAYPPILLLAYWTARQIKIQAGFTIALSACVATLVDTVLDPAAVRLGFWHWNGGGFYYGVPLVNFLGWLLTAAVGALLLHLFLHDIPVKKLKAITYSGIAIAWFWTWVNVFLLQVVPACVGLIGLFILLRYIHRSTGILQS